MATSKQWDEDERLLEDDHTKWRNHPWPVFLTNWSYLALTMHLVLAATAALLHTPSRRCCRHDGRRTRNDPRDGHDDSAFIDESALDNQESSATETDDRVGGKNDDSSNNRDQVDTLADDHIVDVIVSDVTQTVRWYLQLSWLLFTVSGAAALVVTSVYFGGLYPQLHVKRLSAGDVTLHVMNSVIIAIECCVAAIPVRLLHIIYVFTYMIAYVLFSVVYWAVDHNNVLYPDVLDWNQPARTGIVLIILGLGGLPVVMLLLFGAYRLRVFVHRKIVG